MAVLNHVHFDVIDFIKKSRAYGASEQLAEFNARQFEAFADIITEQRIEIDALKAKEPATKGDVYEVKQEITRLELKIEQTKNQLLLWMFAMLTGFAIFFLGALAKGFHWL